MFFAFFVLFFVFGFIYLFIFFGGGRCTPFFRLCPSKLLVVSCIIHFKMSSTELRIVSVRTLYTITRDI